MKLRTYISKDCDEIIKLFYETVHSVNSKDYSKAQLNAWTESTDFDAWDKSFSENYTIVVTHEDKIIGFGDLRADGYFDKLFIHKDYQGKGIAGKITDSLESYGRDLNLKSITTHASITAKSFFERRNYKVIKEQQVERRGQYLTNYVMEKTLY